MPLLICKCTTAPDFNENHLITRNGSLPEGDLCNMCDWPQASMWHLRTELACPPYNYLWGFEHPFHIVKDAMVKLCIPFLTNLYDLKSSMLFPASMAHDMRRAFVIADTRYSKWQKARGWWDRLLGPSYMEPNSVELADSVRQVMEVLKPHVGRYRATRAFEPHMLWGRSQIPKD